MSYGEATELFTSLSKLWRMLKTPCPCLRDFLSSCLTIQTGQWCQKWSGYLHIREETLRTFPLLTMYYFITPRELPTKMDNIWDSAWNGDGQDPSQMHGSLCGPRNREHQSPIGEVTIKYVCMVYRELVQSRKCLKAGMSCTTSSNFVENARLKLLACTRIRIKLTDRKWLSWMRLK